MDNLAYRIKAARTEAGLTQQELADACHVTRNAISQWESQDESQRTTPGVTRIQKIAKVTKVAAEWLLSGQGPKHILTTNSSINVTDRMSATVIKAEPPTGSQVGSWDTLDDLPPDKYLPVPHYDVQLAAGDGAIWTEHEDGDPIVFRSRWFRAKGSRPEHCRALYVKGDSMHPTIPDGFTVVIDITKTKIQDDEIFAVMYYGELYIKRLFHIPGGGVELRSDNERHRPRFVEGPDLEHLAILGQMIWRAG